VGNWYTLGLVLGLGLAIGVVVTGILGANVLGIGAAAVLASVGAGVPAGAVDTVSGEVVIYNVMGGMGTLVGPVVGAATFLLLREGLSRFWTEYYLIPLGIAFTLMVIFMPQGLLGFWKRRLNQ